MYFLAESNNTKYELNIRETDAAWFVSMKPQEREWLHFEFSKTDYQYMDETISFLFKDSSYLLDVTSSGIDYTVYTRGAFRTVKIYNEEALLHESLKGGTVLGHSDTLKSEMPGKIVKIFVSPGQEVKAGDPLLIMEAMKMENEMRATQDAKIKNICVKEGVNVETNTVLLQFEK
jgi:biotin carboxyl carrier protein